MKYLYLFEDQESGYFLASCHADDIQQTVDATILSNLKVLYENGKIVNKTMNSYTSRFFGFDVLPIGVEKKREEEKHKHGFLVKDDQVHHFDYATGYSLFIMDQERYADYQKVSVGRIYLITARVVDLLLENINQEILKDTAELDDIVMGLRIIFSLNAPIRMKNSKQELLPISKEYVTKVLDLWQNPTKLAKIRATQGMAIDTDITPMTLFMILAGYDSINITEDVESFEIESVRFPTLSLDELLL